MAFVVKNRGQQTVFIEWVETDCGCSAATLSTNSVAPGATAVVNVSFDLTGRTGKQFRNFYVYTKENPRNPLVLRLEGNSAVRTEIKPRLLKFLNVSAGESHRGRVVLRGLKGDICPGTPQSSSKKIHCILKPGNGEHEYILNVILLPDLPDGTHTASIIIPAYNGTKMLVVPVYAVVKKTNQPAAVPEEASKKKSIKSDAAAKEREDKKKD